MHIEKHSFKTCLKFGYEHENQQFHMPKSMIFCMERLMGNEMNYENETNKWKWCCDFYCIVQWRAYDFRLIVNYIIEIPVTNH